MQTPLVKRSLLTILDTSMLEQSNGLYKEPCKKVKKSLSIDIPEPYAEDITVPVISTSRPKSAQFSFNTNEAQQSYRSSTSTPPRFAGTSRSQFDFPKFLHEQDTGFDNFYHEDDSFNVTMKKCHRRVQEDRVSFEKINEKKEKTSFFGVYDGHRNSYVSDFLQKNLAKAIVSHPNFYTKRSEAIKEVLYSLDQDICKTQEKMDIHGGSTALFTVIGQQKMHVINVGDSKAVVIRDGEALTLTAEHNANNENEKKTVESRGGYIFEKKVGTHKRCLVQGSLEVTRSLGDRMYKKYISCEPDILEYELTNEDEYILLGSDGFWKEMNEQEVLTVLKAHGKPEGLSNILVDEILKKKKINLDNISLIVVDLKKLSQHKEMLE